jgi:small subunit ribosomal protein S13
LVKLVTARFLNNPKISLVIVRVRSVEDGPKGKFSTIHSGNNLMAATRYIIRVANTDLNGEKPIALALCKIKGIHHMFASALCYVAGIDKRKKAGDLSDAEEKQLNDLIRNPAKAGIPEWMLNRRNDVETGETMHLIGSDIAFTKDNDIKRQKKLKTYKGIRHAAGLPVRGQRTKSNFRKNKKKGTGKKQERKPRTPSY